MFKKMSLIAFIILITSGVSADQENPQITVKAVIYLTLQDVLRMSVENSADLLISGYDLDQVSENALKEMRRKYPRFSFSLGGSGGESYLSAPVDDEMEMLGINGGLSIRQLLPTYGELSLSLNDSISLNTLDENLSISQSPSLQLRLTQPVLLNGKFIDTDVYKAEFDLLGESVETRELLYRTEKNRVLSEAFTLYLAELYQQKQIANTERRIKLKEQRLAGEQLMFEQGFMSFTDFQKSKLELDSFMKSVMELEYRMLTNHQLLLQTLGIREDVDVTGNTAEFPEINIKEKDELVNAAMENSDQIIIKSRELESVRKSAVLSGLESAVLMDFGFSLTPHYPDERTSEDNFGRSFSDFFENGAGLDWSLSLGVNVPIDEIGKNEYRNRINESRIMKAEKILELAREDTANKIILCLENRKFLEKRKTFLENSIALDRKTLEDTRKLFEFEMVTELDVEEASAELESKQNQLWEIESLLFLNALDIYSLCGDDLEDTVKQQF